MITSKSAHRRHKAQYDARYHAQWWDRVLLLCHTATWGEHLSHEKKHLITFHDIGCFSRDSVQWDIIQPYGKGEYNLLYNLNNHGPFFPGSFVFFVVGLEWFGKVGVSSCERFFFGWNRSTIKTMVESHSFGLNTCEDVWGPIICNFFLRFTFSKRLTMEPENHLFESGISSEPNHH